MIDGHTLLIAHLGYPTATFKSPMIYNPYFESVGVNAVVVPMGVRAPAFPALLVSLSQLINFRGALITMPHKVTTMGLVERVSPRARVAGACNAVRVGRDGALEADMFDGEGFVQGVLRKGRTVRGASALIVGSGGVGSAIAASLASAGIARLGLYDLNPSAVAALAGRLSALHPGLTLMLGSNDPAGFDLVVNATPLGMNDGDPLPVNVERIEPDAMVGEVVLRQHHTALLRAALHRGCDVQVGTDMLFEQIPAYLDYFDFPVATPDQLRAVARLPG